MSRTFSFNLFDKHAPDSLYFKIAGKSFVNVLNSKADPCLHDLAILHKVGYDPFCLVNGYGKTDSLSFGIDGCIDSYQLAVDVQKRSPAVPGIDGCIGLYKTVIHPVISPDAPVYRADDTGCDGM